MQRATVKKSAHAVLMLAAVVVHDLFAGSDPNCKDNTSDKALELHRLHEPSVTFGPTTEIEHDMVGSTITFRIDGKAMDPADFVSESGQRFTLADGNGLDRWELKGRVTRQTDGTYLFDALVKCADAVIAQRKVTTQLNESTTIKVDGQACPGKRKSFEADARFITTRGTKAAVVDVSSFTITYKVYVDEHGVPKSVQFMKSTQPMTRDGIDDMAATLLTWEFTPPVSEGKAKGGYIIVPMIIN
jgi:hypothetical protein